jgi:hypothetical protein
MIRRLLVLAAMLAVSGAHAETDYSALLDEALDAIDWEYEKEWAYTKTTLQDGELWVGRYDPRVSVDDGWKLISVDGREPTSAQVHEFLHDIDDPGEPSDKSIAAIVEPRSLELIEETDDHWLFSFVPGGDEEAINNNVDATVKIIKDGRYVSHIEMHNHSTIKPGFGTKLTSFLTWFSFGPAVDGGPIVPKSVKVQVAGRALLFIAIDETETIEYSDFEYAGAPE